MKHYKLLWIFIPLFILVSFLLKNDRRPIAFEIPQGYVGWIRVKYNVIGATPLPTKNGYYVAYIPANGLLKTSTIEEEGGATDQFYYVNPTKQSKQTIGGSHAAVNLIWGDAGRTNERWMFVGTEQQFADAQRLIGGSDPGPLKMRAAR